jgi:NAD(P)-dependent dehydrogenase (short-subunit alcohol dehydrogenase family)
MAPWLHCAAFVRVLAIELAEHRINVNAVAPGVIEIPQRATQPSARGMNEKFRAALIEAIP